MKQKHKYNVDPFTSFIIYIQPVKPTITNVCIRLQAVSIQVSDDLLDLCISRDTISTLLKSSYETHYLPDSPFSQYFPINPTAHLQNNSSPLSTHVPPL